MYIEGTIEEPGSRTAGTVLFDRLYGRFFYPRIVGETHIAVRPEHEHLFIIDHDLGVLGRIDHPEIWI